MGRKKKKISMSDHILAGYKILKAMRLVTQVHSIYAYKSGADRGSICRGLKKTGDLLSEIRWKMEDHLFDEWPQDATLDIYAGRAHDRQEPFPQHNVEKIRLVGDSEGG